MTILELIDAVTTNEDIKIEIYDIDIERTVWKGTYDGFQPRYILPEKYWKKEVDSFSFDTSSICINY